VPPARWQAIPWRSASLAGSTVPPAEDIGLPGTLFKFRIGDRHLLRSGSHRVVVRRAGYHTLDEVIEVGSSPAQSVRLELTRLPGLLAFSTPPEAGPRWPASWSSVPARASSAKTGA